MTSVLASQLQELARQRQPALPAVLKKGKPSLLFDFQKAADVDLQTIYDLACQGLEDLTRLEPRFRPYRESLFSRSSLDINPELQTVDFLSKLDESIHGFCCLLSDYFLAPPAFKALEYLIRRYKANERNVDTLLTAALPYHSTNEFVRLVQTLAIGAPGSLWGWLAKMQTSGASLPRDLLAQRCANDRPMLLFICKAAAQLGGASSETTSAGAVVLRTHSRTFLSFYAVLVCEVLAVLPSVGEDLLAALLPYLLEGLGRGAGQDYRAATLMAVAELCSRATLGRDFIKVLFNTMLKYTETVPEHVRTVLLVMAHVAVTQQHIRLLSDKTLKHLSALPNLVSELASLAQRGNIRIGPLLVLLVRSLAASLVSSGGRRSEGDLLALAHEGALRGDPAQALASALLEAGGSAKADAAVQTSCRQILRVLDQRYPETTDAAVNAFLEPLREQRLKAAASAVTDDNEVKRKRRKTHHKTDVKIATAGSDDDDDDAIDGVAESASEAAAGLEPEDRARFDFVRSAFTSGGYSAPCGGTMLTLAAALSAPQAAVRRMALQQLDSDLASGGDGAVAAGSEARTALTAAALGRLRDDDLGVVVAALGLSCLRALPPAALLDALQPLACRLGEYLYGNAKLPQLKAARKAVRKVVSLLRHAGSTSGELGEVAAVQLLAMMMPSHRDTGVAVEAVRAASKLGLPLFSDLSGALAQLESQLNPAVPESAGAKAGKGGAKAGKSATAAAADGAASGVKVGKKVSQKAVAAAMERVIVAALAKALSAGAVALAPVVKRLVAAAAAASAGRGPAESASRRAHHLLLLAAHAAAATSAAKTSKPSATALTLLRIAVDLAETLLPYTRVASASEGKDWSAAFAEEVSTDDGLPTAAHSAGLQTDAVATHAIVILGALHAGLTRLPEAKEGDADPAAATRVLRLLSSLEYSTNSLRDLPVLVTTRAVQATTRHAFLAGLYAAPPSSGADSPSSVPSALRCLALHIQAQLAVIAAAAGAGGSRHAAADVSSWLCTLLAALAHSDASVRSAACDCLSAVGALREPARVSSGPHLSAKAASALCSGLLVHRKLLCRDSEAAHLLLRAALHGGADAATVAAASTPSRKTNDVAAAAAAPTPAKKGSAASASAKDVPVSLELSAAVAGEVAAYLTSCLHHLDADAVGINTACAVLACLVHKDTTVSSELFAAGCAYLSRINSRLRDDPASASALHAHAVHQLLSLFTPISVATAAACGQADRLSRLAEAIELLPPPASSPAAASTDALAALAAARLSAVTHITTDLFSALPPNGRTVRELFAVLLGRYEGDADEAVRTAARTSLETIPLSAELIVPLLDPPSAATTPARSVKKSKKSDAGSVAAVEPPAAAAIEPAVLRDAVAALELLQWRTGIDAPHLLVSACQSLLRKLLPIVGSIASTMPAEDAAAEDDDDDAAAADDAPTRSSLAGYAAALALQALTALAKSGGWSSAAPGGSLPAFDLDLAVRTAREAPDAAVRNAALGLLAALATRMPEAALSHVLQVLSVINQSAALQDDEHSRAVGATALAAVVPAWMAEGQPSTALWDQVISSLALLPAHRRLDILLALMRALPKVEEGLPDGLLVLLKQATDPKPPALVSTPTAATTPGSSGKPPKSAVKKARVEAQDAVGTPVPEIIAGPPPSEWLLELASQLALQVELPVRLASCARVMELALSSSRQQPQTALPRTVVAFVTAQLKLKVAVTTANATFRRPDPDAALEAACRRLMVAALAQMQLLQPDAVAADHGSTASPRVVISASRGLYDLFAALQGVMAADTYLQALLTLAEHPSDKVKRRAIKLFTDKVRGVRSEIEDQIELPQRVRDAKLRQASDAAARACAMLPPLLSTASAGAGGASPLTRQLALVALSAIASEFGAPQHVALLAGVPAVLAATKDAHASIRASSLATVAAFVRALGARLVPVLPATVAAAVAAADSAWARLARAGTAAKADDAEMPDVTAAADSDDDDDVDADGSDEDDPSAAGGGRRSRRRRGTSSDADDAALELSSALACLTALVETLGGFLSPHLPSVLAILLNPRVLACRVAGCDKFASSIRSRLPTEVPPRLLLPALYDMLQPCLDAAADAADAETGAAPTVALLTMVGAAAASLEAKLAAQYHEHIFAFLLRALDVRQRRPTALAALGDAAIDAVEAAAIRALVSLVMKLSEARFKPLFLRMLEWASTVSLPEGSSEPSYLGRMVALFGAVNGLADRLRSVLVPYYRYLLDACVQHLGGDDAGGSGKSRGKKKQKRSLGAAAAMAAGLEGGEGGDNETQLRLAWLLRLRIVRALHRCFLHDSVSFVDPERFARLQPALISALESEPPADVVAFLLTPQHADRELAVYTKLGASTRAYTAPDGALSAGPMGAAAVGCLLAMAVAANSDALWKPLNHATLMLTRSSSMRTRALALEVVAQLVDRLREEYLVLLPEALPFMSELLEDTDAAVAARVREVVAQLEEVSGEKLDEYLKV